MNALLEPTATTAEELESAALLGLDLLDLNVLPLGAKRARDEDDDEPEEEEDDEG